MNSFLYIIKFTNNIVTSVWAKNHMDAEAEAEKLADEFKLKVWSVKMASPFAIY